MRVSFQLPDVVAESLRQCCGDLDQTAKEAALVELYRQKTLTHFQLATALELDRFETDAVLKEHGVTEDLLTPAEVREQLLGLREVLGE